jgi:hypothetical protein
MLTYLLKDRDGRNGRGRVSSPVRAAMAALVKHAKALLLVTMILIAVGSVPVLIGMVGRSLAHDQAVTAFEPQLDRPAFHW